METALIERLINNIIKSLEKNVLIVIRNGELYNLGYGIFYNKTTPAIIINTDTIIGVSPTQKTAIDTLIAQTVDKQDTRAARAITKQLQSAITIAENMQNATTTPPPV